MLAPNATHYAAADHRHQENLSHAARIRMAAKEHGPDGSPRDRDALRRVTARRLSAAFAALLVTVVLAVSAVAAGNDAAADETQPAPGGRPTYIR